MRTLSLFSTALRITYPYISQAHNGFGNVTRLETWLALSGHMAFHKQPRRPEEISLLKLEDENSKKAEPTLMLTRPIIELVYLFDGNFFSNSGLTDLFSWIRLIASPINSLTLI